MPNILLTRIDNRLVHGQVGVTWTTALGANLILVANDQSAKDKLMQDLMGVTAKSSGAGIRFFSIQKTIEVIHKAADRQKIFLVVKTPQDVKRLIDGNVPISELNVGNMHFSEGKKSITKKVYVNQDDLDTFKYIEGRGVHVFIQDYPDGKKSPIIYN
ncbi:PTS galactosamine transporter subunit IIB [Sporolactobacillus shoreicorticis]|uniref:PTS galactosamine transporter subunit IIB n=1 Tax=Sporolactobacillus shoreicorticis TaxID=1923877 RepID=A0ABW5S2D2_9BACL|nr:PTS galactosamine transporter subunit IIB [Sporolactobacillus shoreicorticis]MCO7124642.1 PTS galactosamine transporter subunit IIB [Sporolactobacillus shoreicorticis]